MGGGTTAFFTFETTLQPQQTTLSSFNNRQAFIGLGQKGLGNARIGTQNTPIHEAVGLTSANQQNNLTGDVIYPQNTGITNRDGSATNNNAGYTIRANNMLRLESDTFAGFRGKAFYVQNNRNENQATLRPTQSRTALQGYQDGQGYTGGNTNSTGWGLGVDFRWQKLLVMAAYQSFKTESPWTYRETLTPVATGPNPNNIEVRTADVRTNIVTGNSTDNQWYAGATYDFGIVKAFAQYINRKETSGLDSNAYVSRTAQQLGVRGNVTKTIELWGSAGMGRYNAFGTGSPTANFTGYQLGSNYWLSKRTNLYAIFGATNTSQTSVLNTNYSANANNYAIGARHTF